MFVHIQMQFFSEYFWSKLLASSMGIEHMDMKGNCSSLCNFITILRYILMTVKIFQWSISLALLSHLNLITIFHKGNWDTEKLCNSPWIVQSFESKPRTLSTALLPTRKLQLNAWVLHTPSHSSLPESPFLA
jgi:hypothetical protein